MSASKLQSRDRGHKHAHACWAGKNAGTTLQQSRACGTARSSPPFQRRGSASVIFQSRFAGRLAKKRDFNPASRSLTIFNRNSTSWLGPCQQNGRQDLRCVRKVNTWVMCVLVRECKWLYNGTVIHTGNAPTVEQNVSGLRQAKEL